MDIFIPFLMWCFGAVVGYCFAKRTKLRHQSNIIVTKSDNSYIASCSTIEGFTITAPTHQEALDKMIDYVTKS